MASVPFIQWRITDANGDPVSGGKVKVEAAGTTDLSNVYSDAGLSVAMTNPIVADASGVVPEFFLANGSYKFTLLDADDAVLDTFDNQAVQQHDMTAVLYDVEGSLEPYHFGQQAQYTVLTNPNGYDDVPQWATVQQLAGAFEGATFTSVNFSGTIDFTNGGANIRMKDTDFGDHWGRVNVDDAGHMQFRTPTDDLAGNAASVIVVGRGEDPTVYPQTLMTLEHARAIFQQLSDTVEIATSGIAVKMIDTDYSSTHFAALYPNDVGQVVIRTAKDQSLGNTTSHIFDADADGLTDGKSVVRRKDGDTRYAQTSATTVADSTGTGDVVAQLNALLAILRTTGAIGT